MGLGPTFSHVREGFSDRKIGKREARGTEPPEGEGNRQEGDIAPEEHLFP